LNQKIKKCSEHENKFDGKDELRSMDKGTNYWVDACAWGRKMNKVKESKNGVLRLQPMATKLSKNRPKAEGLSRLVKAAKGKKSFLPTSRAKMRNYEMDSGILLQNIDASAPENVLAFLASIC
jgi:hypothetical protein